MASCANSGDLSVFVKWAPPISHQRGSCGKGFGAKLGLANNREVGNQPEACAAKPTDAATPRPASMSSFLTAYQTSIQLRGHIQRESCNLICLLCSSCAQSTTIYLFIPIPKIKREMKTHLFHYFFLHSSAFQLTKIHIYANV